MSDFFLPVLFSLQLDPGYTKRLKKRESKINRLCDKLMSNIVITTN